jgi:hypothetical protein
MKTLGKSRLLAVDKDLAALDQLCEQLPTPVLLEVWSSIEFALRKRGLLLPEETVSVRLVEPLSDT